jgi:hypothetical protein
MTDETVVTKTTTAISACTEVPIEFIIAGIYCVLAETTGRFYKLHPTLGRFKLLNIFSIIGSPPHITHRSDLVKCLVFIVETAIKRYWKLQNVSEDDEQVIRDIEAHTLQASGSTEGLVDKIEELYNKGERSFLIIDPEIGKTFDAMNEKGSHMSGTTDIICRLYTRDSKVDYFSQKTKDKTGKISRRLPTDISVSILGAMQNPEFYLKDKQGQVGVLRRLWITALRGNDLPPLVPLISEKSKDAMYDELAEVGDEIGEMMFDNYKTPYHSKVITWDAKVVKAINDFDRKHVQDARDNDDDTSALAKVTFGEISAKLAGIKATSERRDNITLNDIEYCQKLLIDSAAKTEASFMNMMISTKMNDTENHLKMIKKYFKKGLTRREVQQRMCGYGVHKTLFTEDINILLEDGAIKLNKDGG